MGLELVTQQKNTPRVTALRGVFLLLLLILTWVAMTRLPLFDEDEGEYAEVAVEMASSHDFITPTLNGSPFYEKPILAFWLEAPLVNLFGAHPWVFRLPSELACLLWLWLIMRFAREFLHPHTGQLAQLFCASSLGVVVSAQAAAMDGVLSALVAATLFDIYRYFKTGRAALIPRVYLWMALGFLAKGPIAVVIPLVSSFFFFLTEKKLSQWFRAILFWPAWVLFLLITLPWYVMQYHLMGQAFIDYFLLRENVGRLVGTLQGHTGHWWYYFPVLLFIALPHTTLLIRSLFKGIVERNKNPLLRFLLVWFISVFVIFSVAQTKLPHYLLIGLTPLFLLMGMYVNALKNPLWWGGVAVIEWLLLAILPSKIEAIKAQLHNPYISAMLSRTHDVFNNEYYVWLTIVIIATIILAVLLRFVFTYTLIESTRLSVTLSSHILLLYLILPAIANLQQQPVIDLARYAKQFNQPVVADNRMPSFAVMLGRPTQNRHAQQGELVFLRVDQLADYPQHQILKSEGGLVLLRVN
ncbi:MAG: glycosyltransferase family 39 protein [Betaproteobacteria bacterium]|nr:glycosyltransferase family 39 protein [Betaproteobacteria bacterium]